MDEAMVYEDYRPGHFHLQLNINSNYVTGIFGDVTERKKYPNDGAKSSERFEDTKNNVQMRDLTFRYHAILNDYLENDVPDHLAALNLLGLLAFRMNKLEKSAEHFKEVLLKDSENVNGLQNLAYVYSQLNENDKADSANTQVRDLLGRGEHTVNDQKITHLMACSIAEHAYANAYDVGLLNCDAKKDRFLDAIGIYDHAMQIGGSVITLEERRRWYFVLATIFVHLDTLMIRSRDKESARLPGINRTINFIRELSKSDQGCEKVLAWSYLGILMERQATFDTTPMSIHDCGFTGLEPLDCFGKAIELADKQPHLLNRLAKVFQAFGKYELSLGAASMSIDIDANPETNLSPYHTRAKVNTSIYMKDLSRSKVGSSTMPERILLETSLDDLDKIISVSPSLRAYIDIGQVYYYMGVDAIKESFIVNEDYVNKAMISFSKGFEFECGDTLPELQLLRGKCLRVKGEEENALKCFRRAMEMDRKGSRNTLTFHCLMETLLIWYYQDQSTLKREIIIDDVDNCIAMATEKFENDVILYELRALSNNYAHELLELCRGTIKSGKTALAKLCFAMFPSKHESIDTESNL